MEEGSRLSKAANSMYKILCTLQQATARPSTVPSSACQQVALRPVYLCACVTGCNSVFTGDVCQQPVLEG
eukprot:scaffold155739_cov21-Tisochrysis_lutea.AAC.1